MLKSSEHNSPLHVKERWGGGREGKREIDREGGMERERGGGESV